MRSLTAFVLLVVALLAHCANAALEYGVVTTASVDFHDSRCFKIAVDGVTEDINIQVTPTSLGDPDVGADFDITCGDGLTVENATYASTSFFGDSLNVPIAGNTAPSNFLYISVYGWTSVTFTLLVTKIGSQDAVRLLDGIPQNKEIGMGEVNRFNFPITNDMTHVIITAVPRVGRLQFFVAAADADPIDVDDDTTYDLFSHHEYQGEEIAIYSDDDAWPTALTGFQIAVVGRTGNSSYVITAASSENATTLQPSIAHPGHVLGGELKYYKSVVSQDDCTLDIQLTTVSGDADLFVSTDTFPDASNAMWSHTNYGSDEVIIGPDSDPAVTTASTFYIGVLGFNTCTYTINTLITCAGDTDNTYTTLQDGTPQRGTITAPADGTSAHMWYSFHVTADIDQFSVGLVSSFGSPRVFLSTERDPNFQNKMWALDTSEHPLITIRSTDDDFCSDCVYYMNVGCQHEDCSYTVTYSSALTEQTITEGQSVSDHVDAHGYTRFKFYATHGDKDVRITVTPSGYGDPDVYVSTESTPNKDTDSWMWKSATVGDDTVTIPPTDDGFCFDCWYYIAVYGFSSADFFIVAHQEGTIELSNGVPQTGPIDKDEIVYFSMGLNLANDDDQVTVTLTQSEGSLDLYISETEDPEPTDPSTYVSHVPYYSSVNSVTFAKSDLDAATSRLYIGVLARYGDGVYSLVASATHGEDGTSIPLRNGVAQQETLQQAEWDYFYFTLGPQTGNSSWRNLTFSVSALSGDPDIYVSTTERHPDATNADEYSVDFGTDVIQIPNAAAATYYVGVTAFTNSVFTILAHVQNNDPTDPSNLVNLVDGQPQIQPLRGNHWYYFRYTLTKEDESYLAFTLTSEFGDPDMYIKKQTGNNLKLPTRSNFDYDSLSMGIDMVRVDAPETGEYVVGVFAFVETLFHLTASRAESTQSLSDGISVPGTIGHEEGALYSFHVNDADATFSVWLSPFSGDPDLYVAANRVPTKDDYDWDSESMTQDIITVSKDDDNHCGVCTYYIYVYGFASSSQYTITAAFKPTLLLTDGISLNGAVEHHDTNYYSFRLPRPLLGGQPSPFNVQVTPINGFPILFVSTNEQPTNEDAMWESEEFVGGHVTVQPDDDNYCNGASCVWNIGVYGLTASNYSIVVTTGLLRTPLRSGIPHYDYLGAGQEWAYYTFTLTADHDQADVMFSLTASSGDPDLYVSLNEDPDEENFGWESERLGDDQILIERAASGVYHIGVNRFYGNSSYAITATAHTGGRDDVINLVDGQPQSGYIRNGTMRYYKINLVGEHEKLAVVVAASVGDPDLFLARGYFPTLNHTDKESMSWGGDGIELSKPAQGAYYIGVYGFESCEYTIIASVEGNIRLLDGVSVQVTQSAGSTMYYEFMIPNWYPKKDLNIVVNPWVGDPDVYVSRTAMHPNFTNSQWGNAESGGDAITIPNDELEYGYYYIAVYAFTNTSYYITLEFDKPVQLVDGQSRYVYVESEEVKYLEYYLPDGHESVEFSLDVYYGVCYMMISQGRDPDYEHPNTIDWAIGNIRPGDVGSSKTISEGDDNFATSAVYSIGIVGEYATCYGVISASSSAGVVRLASGVPRQVHLAADTWAYYSIFNPLPSAALQFAVTALHGDPDVYVSTNTSHPSGQAGHWQWKSTSYGTDIIAVDTETPGYITGEYFIGVYAYSNATLTVAATVIDLSTARNNKHKTYLTEGIPQLALLEDRGDWFYYSGNYDLPVTISVSPYYGDPDFYVIRGQWLEPNATYNDMASTNFGRDSLVVTWDDLRGAKHPGEKVYLSIGVKAFSHTLYSISATHNGDGVMWLVNGVSVEGQVEEGEFSYYKIRKNQEDKLTVIVSSLSGDPDVYIRRNEVPTESDYDDVYDQWGDERIHLDDDRAGVYYIGVYGFNQHVSFVITASTGFFTLLDGSAHTDVITANDTQLFQFHVPRNDDDKNDKQVIVVSMDFDYGDATFYVRANNDKVDADHFDRKSGDDGTRYEVTMKGDDICGKKAQSCILYIAVVGRHTGQYSLTASTGERAIQLRDGVSYTGTSGKNEWTTLQVVVDDITKDVNIDCTVFLGEVLLAASFDNQNPRKDAEFVSGHKATSRGVHLNIPHDSDNFRRGTLYIGVYSPSENSRWSVTVATRASMLQDGVPVHRAFAAGYNPEKRFFFNTQEDKADIRFDVMSTLYSENATDYHVPRITLLISPGVENFTAETDGVISTTVASGDYFILFTTDEGHCGSTCTYFIAVQGEEEQSFELTVSTGQTYQRLIESTTVSGAVSPGAYYYYETYAAHANNFTVTLETCTGNTDLYLAVNSYRPDVRHNLESSSNDQAIDVISIKDNTLNSVYFYLGVHGVGDGPSTYRLQVHDSPQVPMIVPGNHGEILADASTGPGEITLTFAHAKFKSEFLNGTKPVYTAYYVADDSPIAMYSNCGIEQANHGDYKVNPNEDGDITIKLISLADGVYKINVVVQDQMGNQALYKELTGIKTGNGGGGDGSLGALLGIGIPLVLLLIAGLIFFAYKNRKLTQELEVEMGEVPNRAVRKAMRGPPSASDDARSANKNTKSYSRLLQEENDDDDFDAEYDPPEF